MSRIEQIELFPGIFGKTARKPVNVATVPLRSPFRYPGGKTWFVPTFREWMRSLDRNPELLIEPFVGGGIISLTALFENLVPGVVMVDLDEDIAAVWQVVINGDAKWLAEKIGSFELNGDTLKEELSKRPANTRERAFQTILKNRTFHGGILANGSGIMKYGENGKGISSRWYPKTLYKRFMNIDSIAGKIDFRRVDGLGVMEEFADNENAVFFIDPPYTAGGKNAGRRLYKYNEINHRRLFAICAELKGNFLMTYDVSDGVKAMVAAHGFDMRTIPMKNTHNNRMFELVIGRDLSWFPSLPRSPWVAKRGDASRR